MPLELPDHPNYGETGADRRAAPARQFCATRRRPRAYDSPPPRAIPPKPNDPVGQFLADPAATPAPAAQPLPTLEPAAPESPPESPATLESLLAHLAPAEDQPPPKTLTRRNLEPRHKRRLLKAALELPWPAAEPAALTPARAWRPLTNAEWDALRPYVDREGPGRPVRDPRTRLNLIFAVATAGLPWRLSQQAAAHGVAMTGDTLSRQFRRWTHAGLWKTLLFALARTDCPPALKAIEYWVLRAARRAMRLMGLGALVLARLLGKLTALPLPPALLPNPILSEAADAMQAALYRRGWCLAQERLHRMLDSIRLAAWRRRPWSSHLAPA